MDARLMVRCTEETAKLFRELTDMEGRKQGKMLEVLIMEYAMKKLIEFKKEEK